jgi:hypothetical protein
LKALGFQGFQENVKALGFQGFQENVKALKALLGA